MSWRRRRISVLVRVTDWQNRNRHRTRWSSEAVAVWLMDFRVEVGSSFSSLSCHNNTRMIPHRVTAGCSTALIARSWDNERKVREQIGELPRLLWIFRRCRHISPTDQQQTDRCVCNRPSMLNLLSNIFGNSWTAVSILLRFLKSKTKVKIFIRFFISYYIHLLLGRIYSTMDSHKATSTDNVTC